MEAIEQVDPILGRKFVTFQNNDSHLPPFFYFTTNIEEENGQLKLKLHTLEQQPDL